MVVGAKVCELTDVFLWFVCGLYVGILTSALTKAVFEVHYYNLLHKEIIQRELTERGTILM